MWTMAPATELTPTAATAAAGSTPAFWRNRTLSVMPPTLAGVMRLTNDDAIWAATAGTSGTAWWGAPPMIETAAAA